MLLLVIENVSGKFDVLNMVIGLIVMLCRCRLMCGSGLCLGCVGLMWVLRKLLFCMSDVNSVSWLIVWLCLFLMCVCGSFVLMM